MKNKKAISWEKISEGTLTAKEIDYLQKEKRAIFMNLVDLVGQNTISDCIPIVNHYTVMFGIEM